MWDDPSLGYWEDGDSIPCSFWDTAGDVTENTDFSCMMEQGSGSGVKRSTKVHVSGFTVGTNKAITIMLFKVQISNNADQQT